MKYALVTGSSSGIGQHICEHLLENDYYVFGISRRGADIDHRNYVDIIGDIRAEEEVMDIFDIVAEDTEELDLIVNAAGIFTLADFTLTESDSFRDHLETNILGTFHILKHSERFMIDNETHVISVSSLASKKGFRGNSAYCASKFGMNGLLSSCREELKERGIRFTNILPGAIDTPLWDEVDDSLPREFMLTTDDFISVFDMVISAPSHVQFPEIQLAHRNGGMV